MAAAKEPASFPRNPCPAGREPLEAADISRAIERFLDEPGIRRPLAYLLDRLPADAGVFVYGGAIRNLIIDMRFGRRLAIKDLDMVIAGIESFPEKAFPAGELKPADLGGFCWYPKDGKMVLDLCRMEDFIMIRQYRQAPTLENLLKSVDFTVNAVAWDVKGKTFHCRERALLDIDTRTLAFNTRMLYDKALVAYRLLAIRRKLDFRFSEEAFFFLKTQIDLETFSDVRQNLIHKSGRDVAVIVLRDYDRLCRFKNYAHYLEASGHGDWR